MRTEGRLYKREREKVVVEMVLYIRLDTCHALACLLTTGLIWKCHLGFRVIYLFNELAKKVLIFQ